MKTSKTIQKVITNTLVVSSLLVAPVCAIAFASELNVTFKQVEKQTGHLWVAVYNSEDNYNGKGEPAYSAMIPVKGNKVKYTFSDIEGGTYAIKLFHDENDNGKMDTNMFGIPKEGYGFSNNVGKFGQPEFREAAFEVNQQANIEIIIR